MTPEEIRTFTQVLADYTGLPPSLILAMSLVSGFGWIGWRTRSWHVLLTRVWRILHGRTPLSDPDIARFAETRTNLIAFRFMSGIRSRTLLRAKRLIRWSETLDEELADIKACGDLFDSEQCRLREERIPGRGHRAALFLALLALGSCSAFSIAGWVTDRAAYRFTQSGTWFLLSEDDAISLTGRVRVTKETCAESSGKPEPVPPYTDEESQILCKALGTPATGRDVRKVVAQQRFVFGILTGILAYLALACTLSLRQIDAALQMKKRLAQKAPGSGCEEESQSMATE